MGSSMLHDADCSDGACSPSYLRSSPSTAGLLFSLLPFILTCVAVSIIASRRIYPLLAGGSHSLEDDEIYLPTHAPVELRDKHKEFGTKTLRSRATVLSFSTTIGLSTVLAELILCEISNTILPEARTVALNFTLPALLFLLIILIPFLEIQSLVRGSGFDFGRSEKGRMLKIPWILQGICFTIWLAGFWWLGTGLSGSLMRYHVGHDHFGTLSEESLNRVGVIGITLMALLSAFASVSAPWHSFAARPRPATDADLARKQAGLDATNEMLAAKRSRLRTLQRKMSTEPTGGFMTKVKNSIRPSSDTQEAKALTFEISGLETMSMSLSNSLTLLKTRHAAAQRAATPLGKALTIPSYAFSIYCLYRIFTCFLNTTRRFFADPGTRLSNTDPVTRFLSLLAKHWDPSLDQEAWSRQISFLLSGVILAASFTSVLQTFHLFTRFTPGLLYQAQTNAALIVAQIAATYVISSALLLRSNLPENLGTAITGVFGSQTLDSWWVDAWFDRWFLVGVGATALGIWAGRKFGVQTDGGFDDWDDLGFEDVEKGQKRV